MQGIKKVRAVLVEEFYRCLAHYHQNREDRASNGADEGELSRRYRDRYFVLSRIAGNDEHNFPTQIDPRKNEDQFYKYMESHFGLTREDAETPLGPQH